MADIKLSVDGVNDAGNHQFVSVAAALTHAVSDHADLTAYGVLEIEISTTTAETATLTVPSDLTTDATHYVWIHTTAAARHAGVYTTDKHRVETIYNAPCSISENFVRIDGLQFYASETNSSSLFVVEPLTGASDVRLSNCILRHNGASAAVYGIYVKGAGTVTAWNCVIYGLNNANSGTRSVVTNNAESVLNLYNCTISGGYYGVRKYAGTLVCKNVYAGGSGAGDFNSSPTMTYCASSDTTADGTGAVDSVALSTDTFASVTPGEATYLKLVAGSALIGAGNAPGGSAPLDYTTDITGATVATWDIGAFDYAAAAAQFARPSSDVAGGTFRSIVTTAPFGPRVIA